MDNIFGKEDSGDEREGEHKDVEEHKEGKSSPAQNSGSKDTEAMETDSVLVKVRTPSKKIKLYNS